MWDLSHYSYEITGLQPEFLSFPNTAAMQRNAAFYRRWHLGAPSFIEISP